MAGTPSGTIQFAAADSSANRKLILGAQLAFIPTGVLTTILGPTLPILIKRWVLNDVQAGNLFLIQFLAALLGVQLSGFLLAKLGYRPSFLLGLALMAAGTATLFADSVAIGMASVGIYGLGLGLIVPTDSLLIAEISSAARTRAVNLLNFFWGFGAVSCSLLVAWAAAHKLLPVFLGCLCTSLVLLILAMWRLPFPPAAAPVDRAPRWQQLIRNPTIWLFSCVFFFYPGAETAVGGWIGSYVGRLGPMEARWAPVMPAFFWAALTVGRALGTMFLSHFSERQVLRTGFATAAGGIILMLVSTNLLGVILGALTTGLSYSTLYPINVSRFSQRFGIAARSIGSTMFSLASIGPAILSWSVGVTSQASGSLRAGLLLPLGATVLLLVIHLRDW